MDSGKVRSRLPLSNETPESMITSGVRWLDTDSFIIWGSDLLIDNQTSKSKIRASTLLRNQYGVTLVGNISNVAFNGDWIAFTTTENGLACLNRVTALITYIYTEAEVTGFYFINEQIVFLTALGNLLLTDVNLKPPVLLREGIKQIDYHPAYGLIGWDHESIFSFNEQAQ